LRTKPRLRKKHRFAYYEAVEFRDELTDTPCGAGPGGTIRDPATVSDRGCQVNGARGDLSL